MRYSVSFQPTAMLCGDPSIILFSVTKTYMAEQFWRPFHLLSLLAGQYSLEIRHKYNRTTAGWPGHNYASRYIIWCPCQQLSSGRSPSVRHIPACRPVGSPERTPSLGRRKNRRLRIRQTSSGWCPFPLQLCCPSFVDFFSRGGYLFGNRRTLG